jgi:D-threo-aldose 1-dehydrogenase
MDTLTSPGSTPIARVPLGATPLQVTRLGLGTAPLGGLYSAVADADADATIGRAIELGIRFFDTAPQYGHGLAEERLGRGLQGLPRDAYVLATKVGRLLRDVPYDDPIRYYHGTPPVNPVFDFSYDGIMRSVEESLQRLGVDRIDVLHIHDPDEHFDEAIDGAYRALDTLRREGSISAVGAGMNQSAMLARFARERDFDCFLLAGRYTLLEQDALDDLLPVCAQRDVAIIAGGVYNSGLLADPRPGAPFDYAPADADHLDRALRLKAICAEHGVDLKAAAIQFPVAHPVVSAVVIGARTPAELGESFAAMDAPLPHALWADLRAAGLLRPDAPTP